MTWDANKLTVIVCIISINHYTIDSIIQIQLSLYTNLDFIFAACNVFVEWGVITLWGIVQGSSPLAY